MKVKFFAGIMPTPLPLSFFFPRPIISYSTDEKKEAGNLLESSLVTGNYL
jgi:hypothetical protein